MGLAGTKYIVYAVEGSPVISMREFDTWSWRGDITVPGIVGSTSITQGEGTSES
jgi:hypothetical protein